MLTACCAIAFLMLGLTLFWLFKGFVVAPTAQIAEIDVAAFLNVLSLDDNRVLHERLSVSQYRRLKRARVRALQGYVKAIAGNCAVTVTALRAKAPEHDNAVEREISALVREALRIRLLCLGFWIALWAEFTFPNLEIRPTQIAGGYERLRSAAERCLRASHAPRPAL